MCKYFVDYLILEKESLKQTTPHSCVSVKRAVWSKYHLNIRTANISCDMLMNRTSTLAHT